MRTKIDVRRAIKERFGTISAFAEQTGLRTQNIIQNIIKGNPSLKKLEELCEKMGCDVTDLFYSIDETSSKDNTNEAQMLSDNKQEESQMQTANVQNDPAPIIQAQPAFCPHCGKQVRVGVVLLPEA